MKRTFIIAMALAAATAAGAASARDDGSRSSGSTTTMRGVETRLEGAVSTVGTEANRLGDATFAERFATEFGVTVDVLTQQRTQFGVEWGDLFLAYSIADASKTTVTIDQIFQMRESGSSWTQIARSLRIPPGRLMHSVQAKIETFTTESAMGGRTSGGSGSRGGSASGRTGSIKGLDRQIDTRLASLEDETSRLGDQTTAERLAQDFGVTVDVLNQQRAQFDAEWGDLLVAYSIMDRAKTTVTIDEIFAMRTNGETWTQIARSLRIPPGQLLRSIRTETQALTDTGLAKKATASTKGSGSAMKTTHGGGSAARIQAGAATRITKTTTLQGRGAMMRAAAQGSMKVHGRK